MNKAVQELDLAWNPPEEPAKSKLDSWYFRSSRCQVDNENVGSVFFPDVHDQLVKTWPAPQSARVHSATQAIFSMFSQVDGAEAHRYVRIPPVEETVIAHLCPASAKTMGSDISLPSKPCRMTAHLASKGLLLGLGGSLRPTCYGGASSVPDQAPAVPGGQDHLTGSGERFT